VPELGETETKTERSPGDSTQEADGAAMPSSGFGGTTTVPEIGSPMSEVMHTAPISPDVDVDVGLGRQAELQEKATLGMEGGDEAKADQEGTGTAL
jgi:hypothetical protein